MSPERDTKSRNALNAASCLFSHAKGTSLCMSLLRGFVIFEKLGMKGSRVLQH